jgi:E1A/CREB-binding protein
MEVLKELQSHEHGWVFATPVNPVELNLDDYFEVIKKPMDLGTIQKNLEAGSYHSFDDFKSDVRLTFENAMKYNEEKSIVHEMAKQLKKKFEQDYKKLLRQMDKEHAENAKKVQACGLCGGEKLLFEPPVFFCNGMNCPSSRIRRNHNFYITADKQYAWCNQCYTELGDTIDLGTMQIKKEALTKRKNDETHEESWVQCDDCERWIHQICGLYNTRQDKENKSAYSCPLCVLDRRKKQGEPKVLPPPPTAEDLPRTKLSEWLEKDVHKKVESRMKELATEKSETENISYDEAYKSLSSGGPVTIRQVTSTDRKHEVREAIKARYIKKNVPDEFPYRCKCIVVFQNIDGVDVVLFALYVYEHGDDNPFPNKKTVYVSYLDSVHFLKPRKMRTFIYHEILISYLDYARAKGFEQAFIWACPPLKGDDYIFYAKPEDQKIPKEVRLRQWYLDMLDECQKRNVVGKVTNMYDQYLADKTLDFSCVPYFEGDYFPGEAENIIKTLNESSDNKSGGGGKKKSGSKSKKSSSKQKAEDKVYNGGRDVVMTKFCEAIEGMKHSFIVAYLNCKTAKPENLVVPKKIMEYRKAHGIICDAPDSAKLEADKSASESKVKEESKADGEKASDEEKKSDEDVAEAVSESKTEGAVEKPVQASGDEKAEETKPSSEVSGENTASAEVKATEETPSSEAAGNNEQKEADGSDKNPESVPSSSNDKCPPTEEKLPSSKKRDADGKAVVVSSSDTKSSSSDTKLDRHGKPLRILDDDTEEIDCEFFNTRQCFLDLCRGNHYQFDELRRAKHTSMMVLWHLQNREAPKFVQQCFSCAREIASGYRHHCNTCPDFDLCTECYRDPNANRGTCNHKLEAIRVDNQGASSGLTEEQRRERQRNIQLHITLIEHASRCNSASCKSSNCLKMKSYLKHGLSCTVKASGGCKLCKRIWTLLRIHAQQCKSSSCPIPQCIAIRKRIRQLQLKQQAMDDRRRQEMNRHYRMERSGH